MAKAHAISAQIWSDYQQGSFDRSLMAYQPLVDGKQAGLLEALRVRAESKRQAAAIHACKLLERFTRVINPAGRCLGRIAQRRSSKAWLCPPPARISWVAVVTGDSRWDWPNATPSRRGTSRRGSVGCTS